MIWANPWAWLGLTAIAVPILVHLLARQTATAIPFPTLRFLRPASIVDVRRRRLSDLVLLAVRVLIVALAVAALAQPFWRVSRPSRVNRIVIVDASASVAIDDARRAAAAEAEGAGAFLAVERRDLGGAVREAAAWLSSRDGAGALTIVSDFQRGALQSVDLAGLPAEAGVRLQRVPMRDQATAALGGVAQWSVDGARSIATWSAPASQPALSIDGLDAATASAVIDAAAATADASVGPMRAARFVMPDSPNRQALLAASSPADEPWMFELFIAAGPGADTLRVEGDRITVFLKTRDLSEVAETVRRALPHLATGAPVAELERLTLTDAELRALEREPAPGAPETEPASWAGRWFWLAVLLLLAAETVLRRTRPGAAAEVHAHAA